MLGCAVDFLVDDACHACGRRHRPGGPPLRGAAAAVADGARVGPVVNHPVCARCASRLVTADGPAVAGWYLPGGAVLTHALDLVAPGSPPARILPGPIWLMSPFQTNDVLLRLIHALKFSRVTSLAAGLGAAMALAAGPVLDRLERPLLVPVPMDARSRRRRGFNQAELLAGELAARWRVPLAVGAVAKPVATAPQSLARRNERLKNVLGAYTPGLRGVEGRNVILVDDLATTGATAAVIAAVLGAAGAATVTVVCAGRSL